MNNKRFTGILPALVTPIDETGAVLERSARDLIEWLLSQGVSGFYICGSTGEGPALPEAARMRMAEITVEQTARRAHVIAHVGAADALSAVRLAEHAQRAGCDAIASVPPTFFYGYGDEEILAYYRRLSERCALPLLAYATGMFKQADITPFVARFMELPTAVGLKFTRYNYYEMHRICELNGGDINVINGPDEMLLCGLAMGADAGIGSTYNLMPERYARLYDSFRRGDIAAAQREQFAINRVIEVLIRFDVIPAIKYALGAHGIDCGCAAFPGKRIGGDEGARLLRALREAGYQMNR